jgi:hypothetical protein
MRRYGFTFIKTDGVDYKGSILIEAVFFIGLLFFSLLIIITPSSAEEIILGYFMVCFVYGILSFLAEILTRTAFFLALILSIFLFIAFSINCCHEWSKIKPNSVILYLNGSMSIYFIVISYISYYLLKKQKKFKYNSGQSLES